MNTVLPVNSINNTTKHIHPADAHPENQPQRPRIESTEAQSHALCPNEERESAVALASSGEKLGNGSTLTAAATAANEQRECNEGTRARPQASCSSEEQESAVALVSSGEKLGSSDMLTAKVLLANEVHTAHLDSCSTHCFVSSDMSAYLSTKGYGAQQSPIRYDVVQGNPLCSTKRVHYVPLTMVREDGTTCTWDRCLFIVADAGAPIILCNPLLRQGSIIRYNPPDGYENILRQGTPFHAAPRSDGATTATEHCPSTEPTSSGRRSPYGPPNEETSIIAENGTEPSKALATDTQATTQGKNLPEFGKTSDRNDLYDGNRKSDIKTHPVGGSNAASTAIGGKSTDMKKRRGDTDMLSPENPYGKNPPLPEEVMAAVKHLKLLSEPRTTPRYSPSQIAELRSKFLFGNPKWGNCLTVAQTTEVSDPETELFLNNLMDKPVYQKSIFSTFLDGCCDLGEFEINSKPGRDTWFPPQPRKFKSPETMKVVDDWLDSLILYKKCRESRATHPAPVTVVMKEQRDPRVCIDYRMRNMRTEVPVYPMPDVQDFLDDTAGFKHYCSFDMAKMFNQFRIKEAHKHLAAFITHRGVYEPNVVLFGLAGGPQHAVRECGGAMAADPLTNGTLFTQWAIQQNESGVQPPYEICSSTKVVKGSRLRPFIDDVTIPSNHPEGMKKLVELFFEFCRKHNLTLSRKKAKIMKTHLRMLGFVVSEKGKHLDPHRIIALLEAPQPRSKETLHALLSSFTFVRMFIPNFASIAAPLYEATKGIIWKGPLSGRSQGIRQVDPDFVWTPEMVRAYDQLRNALLEAPILAKIDNRYALFLSVDASIRGEGWVLWQLIELSDGTKVAVAILYGSRKYNSTESNWETTRQEASAMRSALTDVYDYVFGRHFYVFSDHLNLRFMHNSINRAVLRMRDFLAQFNMTVIHCPGIWNNADAISRIESEGLPIDLAKDLTLTEDARLQGSLTLISRGTYTQEDLTTGGSLLTPNITRATATMDPSGSTARALCTAIHESTAACCFLCDMTELPEELDYGNETLDFQAFSVRDLLLSETNEGFNPEIHLDLVNQWKGDSTVTVESFLTEATRWNNATIASPRIGIMPELWKEHHQENTDGEDWEDLHWCGPIHRDTVVLRTPVATKFKPKQKSMLPDRCEPKERHCDASIQMEQHKTAKAYRNSRSTLREAEASRYVTPKRRVSFDVDDTTQKSTQTPNECQEISTASTQTTPADFRISLIKYPITEDFHAVHNNDSGHHGLDYTYRKLLKRCGSKWANERGEATKIKALLKAFIEACPICQKVRGLHEKVKAKHSFIVSRPFLEVSYDFIVFTRPDKNGNHYIIVAICNFLKLVEMKATPTRDAETVAQFLLELGARYGHMARLRSDREGAFCSLLIKKLNESRGTETAPCIPYHPQANSVCERQNGLIMNHLNALILGCKLGAESKVGWSDLLPFVFCIVNNTPKNPLGISPLSMLYGVFANYDYPLLPTIRANTPGDTSNPVDYVESLMAWQNQLLDITENIQSEHFKKMEHKFNGNRSETRQFHEGDFVLQLKKATNISGKPATKWIGPFLVLKRRDNDPTHPVLDLMNLTNMTVREASIEDCRTFNTSWFDEESLLPELVKLAAIDENEYVVEAILSHKPPGERGKLPLSKYLFQVKWQDFSETTWEPYSGIKDLEPLHTYAQQHPELCLHQ